MIKTSKIVTSLLSKNYVVIAPETPPKKIFATIHFTTTDKRISLTTSKNQDFFRFKNSEIKIAETVIALMQKAVETAKKGDKT